MSYQIQCKIDPNTVPDSVNPSSRQLEILNAKWIKPQGIFNNLFGNLSRTSSCHGKTKNVNSAYANGFIAMHGRV